MAHPKTNENTLRLALLTNDNDALRSIFREDRELILHAARGGLGQPYHEKALPVIVKLLEEELLAGAQQSNGPVPATPATHHVTVGVNEGVPAERPVVGSALPPPSSVFGTTDDVTQSAPHAIGGGNGQELMGPADSISGAYRTGQSEIAGCGGATAVPPLEGHDGTARMKMEGNGHVTSDTDNFPTILPDDASPTAFERCDECVRARATCTPSPVIGDPPTTCIRCSLRGLPCRPPPEVSQPPSRPATPFQGSPRPVAVHTESPVGSPEALATLLAALQRINPIMAEASRRGETMRELSAALRGAVHNADHALGRLREGSRPSASQGPSAIPAWEPASSPSLPSPAQRPEDGRPHTRVMTHSVDRQLSPQDTA